MHILRDSCSAPSACVEYCIGQQDLETSVLKRTAVRMLQDRRVTCNLILLRLVHATIFEVEESYVLHNLIVITGGRNYLVGMFKLVLKCRDTCESIIWKFPQPRRRYLVSLGEIT
jgi:hypothetical protein